MDMTFRWSPSRSARTLSLPEQIAERIGNSIIMGEFKPGQRVQEQELADQFEVSRGPVREALRILEKDGMIRILPRRGAQVTSLDVNEVNDLFAIRASLIGLAAKLATERQDPEFIQEMKRTVEKLISLARTGESADIYVAHVYAANLALARGSGNERLTDMIFSLAHQTLRYARLGLSTGKRRSQSSVNWKRLVEAMERNDPRAAQEAAEQLVYDSRAMAVRLLREEEGESASEARIA